MKLQQFEATLKRLMKWEQEARQELHHAVTLEDKLGFVRLEKGLSKARATLRLLVFAVEDAEKRQRARTVDPETDCDCGWAGVHPQTDCTTAER